MHSLGWKTLWHAALPAAVMTAAALALAAWGYSPDTWRPLGFIGWTAALFVLATFSAVAATAHAARNRSPHAPWLALLTFAAIVDLAGLLILILGAGGAIIGFATAVRLYLLLLTWVGLWTALVWTWRTRAAIALSLTLAMVLLAAPVTLMPLARAPGPGPGQTCATTAISLASPLLGMVDALQPQIPLDWTQLPRMYELSGLRQDIPMELQPWWLNTALYAAAALAILIAGWLRRRTTIPA